MLFLIQDMSFQQYSLLTLNVNELQNLVKRCKLIAGMKEENHHMILWQETHFTKKGHKNLNTPDLKTYFIYQIQRDPIGELQF